MVLTLTTPTGPGRQSSFDHATPTPMAKTKVRRPRKAQRQPNPEAAKATGKLFLYTGLCVFFFLAVFFYFFTTS